MVNKVLEFDEKIVDKSEIAEQVKNYIDECDKGLNLLSEGDNKGALFILNNIMESLNREYSYYMNKTKVQHIIFVNKDYNDYSKALFDCISKELLDNTPEALEKNFKEIQENMKNHCGYLIK